MSPRSDTSTGIPTPALVLGLGGLLPFGAGAIGAWWPDAEVAAFALAALAAYGAVILSFLGGVRWGNVLFEREALQRFGPLGLSIVPSLVAWCALLAPPAAGLLLLAAGLLAQYALDRAATAGGTLPPWYGRLRIVLTVGAMTAVLVGLAALLMPRATG